MLCARPPRSCGRARRRCALLIATDDRAIGDGLSLDTPRITRGRARRRPRATRPACREADRDWIEAAIAAARPEAQRLIAEVDGLVAYQVHRGDPLGVTRSRVAPDGASFVISFDVASLDGDRRQDRAVTVLHEYGHVIDLALVPKATNDELEAAIPRTGACGNYGGAHDGIVRRAARSASPTRSPSGRCAAASRPSAPATRWPTRRRSRTGARRWPPCPSSSPRRARV